MQHPRLVISRAPGVGLGPVRSASRRTGTGGNLLRPHGNRLRLCVLLAAALCAARFFSWLASPTATRDWAETSAQRPPATSSRLSEKPHARPKEDTVWPSPPPVRAPQAVVSPPPSPPLSPPPETPPAPTAATQPPGCRTCAVANHLVFNSHAVKLFTTIDARPKRGLFVR